jgi:lysophospholipase L1-like esterase
VIGDSLAAGGSTRLTSELAATGWTPAVDAKAGRSIVYDTDARYSGVARVNALRDAGIDPRVWLVELGTNDVYFVGLCGCADRVKASEDRIQLMIDAIGPGHEIYWVGPQRFDQSVLTNEFNQALRNKVASGELAGVVDWSVLSQPHRQDWFADEAHLSVDGYTAWLSAIIDTIGTAR